MFSSTPSERSKCTVACEGSVGRWRSQARAPGTRWGRTAGPEGADPAMGPWSSRGSSPPLPAPRPSPHGVSGRGGPVLGPPSRSRHPSDVTSERLPPSPCECAQTLWLLRAPARAEGPHTRVGSDAPAPTGCRLPCTGLCPRHHRGPSSRPRLSHPVRALATSPLTPRRTGQGGPENDDTMRRQQGHRPGRRGRWCGGDRGPRPGADPGVCLCSLREAPVDPRGAGASRRNRTAQSAPLGGRPRAQPSPPCLRTGRRHRKASTEGRD